MDHETWSREWSEMAHKISFEEARPKEMDRIDFALLMINPLNERPGGYCTVRELDRDSVYLQYGGSFPETEKTISVAVLYSAMIDWLRERYQRVTTLVSNQNVGYLKLCMKYGFRIIGVRCFQNEVFVELLNELRGDVYASII